MQYCKLFLHANKVGEIGKDEISQSSDGGNWSIKIYRRRRGESEDEKG